jgi:hypothetical protein
MDDQPAGQTVEELLQAAFDSLRALVDQETRLKHMQGLVTALAGSTIERTVMEGWLRDAETTATTINTTFAEHGFAWRLVRLQ